MDDIKLRSFITIAQCGSLTRASEKLYLSPTALMRQIDSLEKDLDASLFMRSPSGCTLTQEGAYFLERAQLILSEIDKTRFALLETKASPHTLRICYGNDYAMTSIDQFCAAYSITHPSVSFEFIPLPPDNWLEAIVTKKADCSFIVKDFQMQCVPTELCYTHIYDAQICCVMSANHPLAARSSLTMADLSGIKLATQLSQLGAFYQELENTGAVISNFSSASCANVLNACQNKNIHITIDLMTPQYYPLICIPLEVPTVSCGFVTRKKYPTVLQDFIDSCKNVNLAIGRR